jgi:serine O-acetyltransferase
MNETSFAASEIAASRQRGITVDERELWETLRLDAERAAAGEEMLRGFLDLAVLRHNAFASGLGLLLARKLAEYSMPAERLGEIARSAMAGDPAIIAAAIADLIAVRTRDPAAESCLKPFLYYKGFHALHATAALGAEALGTAGSNHLPSGATRSTGGKARGETTGGTHSSIPALRKPAK